MRFDGRVFYDFSPPVWRFYRFLAAAADEGADLRLDWQPFLEEDDPQSAVGLALVEGVRTKTPERHAAFLQALLAIRHLDGADLTDPETITLAAASAGITEPIASDASAVARSTAEAADLGVTAAPTVYRHGPVLHIGVNPAAYGSGALERLRAIDAVLTDDGIWTLTKP
jgi:hypothetical protein